MKMKVLFTIILISSFTQVKAQKGNNSISINGEVGLPLDQAGLGLGFFFKTFYGIGKSAQLTLSFGAAFFRPNNPNQVGQMSTREIPFLVGYRQNIGRFYVEPQIGFGELGGKRSIGGDFARPSAPAVYGEVSIGYFYKHFDFGIEYRIAHGVDNTSVGYWPNQNFQSVSFHIGFIIAHKSRNH